GAGLIELGLHLGGHALLREGLRVEAVAHEHGGAHADHGGDDHDPQHELHQAHHGDAHDLAHHQLEGLHAADEHFHDAVLLLLHHPAHHLHAVEEDEEEHDVAEEEAHDGALAGVRGHVHLVDVELAQVQGLAHAVIGLLVDALVAQLGQFDGLLQLGADHAHGEFARQLLVVQVGLWHGEYAGQQVHAHGVWAGLEAAVAPLLAVEEELHALGVLQARADHAFLVDHQHMVHGALLGGQIAGEQHGPGDEQGAEHRHDEEARFAHAGDELPPDDEPDL